MNRQMLISCNFDKLPTRNTKENWSKSSVILILRSMSKSEPIKIFYILTKNLRFKIKAITDIHPRFISSAVSMTV